MLQSVAEWISALELYYYLLRKTYFVYRDLIHCTCPYVCLPAQNCARSQILSDLDPRTKAGTKENPAMESQSHELITIKQARCGWANGYSIGLDKVTDRAATTLSCCNADVKVKMPHQKRQLPRLNRHCRIMTWQCKGICGDHVLCTPGRLQSKSRKEVEEGERGEFPFSKWQFRSHVDFCNPRGHLVKDLFNGTASESTPTPFLSFTKTRHNQFHAEMHNTINASPKPKRKWKSQDKATAVYFIHFPLIPLDLFYAHAHAYAAITQL